MTDSSVAWSSETVYHSSKDYYTDLISTFMSAEKSICVETYIFRNDLIGQVVLDALKSCAKKGISIKVMVDGVGSPEWENQLKPQFSQYKIECKAYHPLPWPFSNTFDKFWDRLGYINRRNHRKLFIVDEKICFLGSLNITDSHASWKDIGVRLTGGQMNILIDSFYQTWDRSGKSIQSEQISELAESVTQCSTVYLNLTRRLRKNKNIEIANKIKDAKKRVWIRSPYFLPTPRILSSLKKVAQNGVDVRLMLSNKTDVPASNWLARMFYSDLSRAGVKIYEYVPSVMHAKSVICDDWVLVGSSNLNQRSLRHDLEVDVVLLKKESIDTLAKNFISDIDDSKPNDRVKTGLLEFIGARIMWLFRSWF